ncbi:MAG: TusE/DsrC/DsvC family sulfur relay protein [bacterium]
MSVFEYREKKYTVGFEGFLVKFDDWDENFAEGMALDVNIHDGLTEDHWRVIGFIRDAFKNEGKCPLVYETCRSNSLHLAGLKALFPKGYHRGACKLAGITYEQSYLPQSLIDESMALTPAVEGKIYRIDAQGFLVDPQEWDGQFTLCKAYEMKMDKLTKNHWRIINFVRNWYKRTGIVPTVYETCEANDLDIENLESLFPDGYHRGVIKIAGLRVK